MILIIVLSGWGDGKSIIKLFKVICLKYNSIVL